MREEDSNIRGMSVMSEVTYFVALPFDVADGSVVVGEPLECPSRCKPRLSERKVFWKILGHTGAVAFSRTGFDPATGDFSDATVLGESSLQRTE